MELIASENLNNTEYRISLSKRFEEITYMEAIQEKIRDEKTGSYNYAACHEMELLYLYIHKQQNLFYGKEENTKRDYIRNLMLFYKDVQEIFGSLKQLSTFHMEEYQIYLMQKYAKNTVSKKSTIIRSFLKWLHTIDYLSEDVTSEMKSTRVKLEDQPEKDLSPGEVRRIFDYYKEQHIGDYTLLLLLATTGMRVFELAKAKCHDIFIEDSTGDYFLTVIGKGKKKRYTYLFNDILVILKKYRVRRGLSRDLLNDDELDTPLYPNPKGEHYSSNYLSKKVSELVHKALPDNIIYKYKTGHSLRHGFAEILRENGADYKEIQDALGHLDPRTTQRYLSRKSKIENHAARKIDIRKFL